ncbi:MAG: hypothetical protein ABI779_10460 [Acidobacteriota bacterium]
MFIDDITDPSSITGTTYDWRGIEAMDEEHYDHVVRVARDVFTASAAVVLAECGVPRYADALAAAVPLRVLTSREVCSFAHVWMGQRAFRRFVLRKVIERTVRETPLPATTRDVLRTYLTPTLRSPAINEAEGADIWERFEAFLERWLPSGPFVDLLTLPVRGSLHVSEARRERHLAFVDDLLALTMTSIGRIGEDASWDMLSFWIGRTRQANVWRSAEQESQGQALFAKQVAAMRSYEEDGGWIDYLLGWNTELTIAYLLESAPELYFPIDRRRIDLPRSRSTSWLSGDFFERGNSVQFHVADHPKGKRFLDACRDYEDELSARERRGDEDDGTPISLDRFSREEIVETQRFLASGTRKHFLGHVAEMLALPLVVRYAAGRFGDGVTVIPGTAITYAASPDAQGPDAIIATVTFSGVEAHLRVHALVEVKGCETRRDVLLTQLHNHQRRLTTEQVRLSRSGDRWEPPAVESRSSTSSRVTVNASLVELDDDLVLLSIVPGRLSGRDDSDETMLQLQLPWTAKGIREMTRGFVMATLRESGNKVDVDQRDYTMAQRAWAATVRPHMDDPTLSPEDRASMRQIIDLTVRPDEELLALVVEERKVRRASKKDRR